MTIYSGLLLCTLIYSLLYIHTSVADDDISIIQLWSYDDRGTYFPMTEMKSYCNEGPLVYLRLQYNLTAGSQLIKGGACSAAKTKIIKQGLQRAVEECYADESCGRVDLKRNFFLPLVRSNCSLCEGSACRPSTVLRLQTRTSFTMEVICKKSPSQDTHLTVLPLNRDGSSSVIARSQLLNPNVCQPSKVVVDSAFIANNCAIPLVSTADDINQRRQITSQISDCIHDSACQSVTINTGGRKCDNSKVKPDHSVGFYWSCSSSDNVQVTTNNRTGNSTSYPYLPAFIVITILLIISLIALVIVILYCRRIVKHQGNGKDCEKYRTENNNIDGHTYQNKPAGSSSTAETLSRYQKPVTHGLDDHRYASVDDQIGENFSKTKSAESHDEDLYEYMDPEESLLTKPAGKLVTANTARKDNSKKCNTLTDADGYLIPQP